MAVTMYDFSVPVLKKFLGNLDNVLRKGSAYADAQNIDHQVLLTARLYPNMFHLIRQVQIATDAAKGCGARLAGVEIPKFEDNEASFADLHARIAKTVAFLDTLKQHQMLGSEDKELHITAGKRELDFTGLAYLTTFALPNLFFHVTTAYDILRHNGVEVGKMDYLGG
jgi:uncharacterized protein